VVPYLDVEAMADRVSELLNSPELRRAKGRRAAEKVRDRYDVSLLAPRILEIMERFMSSPLES
jgi:glycosyltransferase involved in cell wall biosynthesis